MAAPTNTKKDRQKIKDQADAAALKAEELGKAGGIPMDGLSPTGMPESTIGMSRNDKFFSQGRLLDQTQREGYKSFGDKGTGEGINAVRALQGRPAISNTPKEFSENINKSVGFGGESALLDQAGRDRALKSGIGAGLSYEEADAAVSKAYDFLKGKYGDKTTPTTPSTLDGSGNDPRVPTPSTIPATPTVPPVVPVEKSPTMQFFSDFTEGVAEGGPERFLVKGGALALKKIRESQAARAAAKAAAEAAAKIAGAAGDVAKPFNMVDDAAKAAAEGLKQRYDFTKPAGGAAKPFSMVDEAIKFADTAKTLNATLDAAAVAAQKTGLDAYNAALQAGQSKEAALAAGNAAEDAALKGAYKDAADNVGKSFDAVDEAAGAADEAAGAADETTKAAGKGKGLFSRLIEGAANTSAGRAIAAGGKAVANSSTGRALATGGRVAGKGLRFVGRAAGPALEIYDAGRYFTGDEKVKNQYFEDTATLGQRVFQPKSVGEFVGGLGDALSPTKNVLGTAEGVRQLLGAQRAARESEAAFKNRENVYKAMEDRRKEIYPDEEFAKLPRNPREARDAGLPEDTPTQSQVRAAIRKEFRAAGARF